MPTIPEIAIICHSNTDFILQQTGWMYSNPSVNDYERVVSEHYGNNVGFTVYYRGVPVCGRVVAGGFSAGSILREIIMEYRGITTQQQESE